MKATEFCYWLQGFFELHNAAVEPELDSYQLKVVRRHLDMVFKHEIDPSYPKEQQAALNTLHSGLPGSTVLLRC